MGNAGAALADHRWPGEYNPAGLAGVSSTGLAAFFVPAQFGLRELRTAAISVTLPLGSVPAGFSASTFGFELYRETSFTGATGFQLSEVINAGVALRAQNLRIAGYGTAWRFGVTAGLQARISEMLTVGACIQNIASSSAGRTGERLPSVMHIGLAAQPTDATALVVELEKHVLYPAAARLGAEQWLLGVLALRGGVTTNPDRYTAGCGVRLGMVEFGYAGIHHPFLGWTHQIDVHVGVSGR